MGTISVKLCLAVFTLSLLAGCANDSENDVVLSAQSLGEKESGDMRDRRGEIVIGATAPLSKPGSVVSGAVMLVAFSMATNEINAKGGILGKHLRVVVKDTAGLPHKGTSEAESLITEHKVVGIVGEYHSAVALAISDVAHRHHVPVIFVDTYVDAITASGYPEIFRIAPTSSFTAEMDAKWLAEVGDYNGDGKLVGVIIAENTDYGVGQAEKARKFFPEYGVAPIILYTDVPSSDFLDTVTEMKSLNHVPDAVFIKVTGESSLLLQARLINAGLGPSSETIVVANQVALDHTSYWENVPNGTYAVVPRVGPWKSTATEAGIEFAEKYYDTFGRWPEAYAFTAYDSLFLMADAIERAGNLDPDAMISALEQTDLELTAGVYSFPYGAENVPGGYIPRYMWHQWPHVPLLFLQYTKANQHSDDMAVVWPKKYRTISGKPIVRPDIQFK